MIQNFFSKRHRNVVKFSNKIMNPFRHKSKIINGNKIIKIFIKRINCEIIVNTSKICRKKQTVDDA